MTPRHGLAHRRVEEWSATLECYCGATFTAPTQRSAFAALRHHVAQSTTRPPVPAPYVTTSDTSREAAEGIEPSSGSLRWHVLAYLREHGPHTDEQLQEALAMPASTERPRRVELVRAGLVRDSGGREFTRSGRRAVLWSAVVSSQQLALFTA